MNAKPHQSGPQSEGQTEQPDDCHALQICTIDIPHEFVVPGLLSEYCYAVYAGFGNDRNFRARLSEIAASGPLLFSQPFIATHCIWLASPLGGRTTLPAVRL